MLEQFGTCYNRFGYVKLGLGRLGRLLEFRLDKIS